METKKKLLIIEDEPTAQKAMSDKFVREGFEVSNALNGEEGLVVAEKFRPDIILLDIIMPKMDGITMLEKLRASGDWGKHVPVIILTNLSFDDKKKMNKLGDLGPESYLVKIDCKLSDVIEKVKKTLGVN